MEWAPDAISSSTKKSLDLNVSRGALIAAALCHGQIVSSNVQALLLHHQNVKTSPAALQIKAAQSMRYGH